MYRLNANILGICETKGASDRDFVSNTHKIIDAGGEKNENCVGLILDNDKEMFWEIHLII